ncbi:DMT family transporter [Roseateles violae]|uniref:DMT family transporter n=1 Tax=Roseateles violae TaxID=3058042 RepID=A0ABT8DNM8_9BURK|nr:DMT family transporter [Pelomonas sp. PFR6]MDN3919598.1 DMT family transporter [Pelomonas sp. PFR6]
MPSLATRPTGPTSPATDAGRGLLLGAVGVFIFALSIPMTRLAGGSAEAPQLDPVFVAMGRAALAGLLSIVYLWATGARRPTRAELRVLALTAAGVVFGWPLFLGWAVRHVDAIHASVISGVLPLATAVIAALVLRQRPSLGFWLCALLGLTLVLSFAWWRGAAGFQWADALLLLAVLSASAGYVSGAGISKQLTAEQVICWVLVLSLPLTLPIAALNWPARPVAFSAWAGFAYVSLFSMWIGFFAWYRALAIGGTVRVSQVQVLQPFASMLLAVPLLGERLDPTTLLFACAVIAVVWVGKKMPVETQP